MVCSEVSEVGAGSGWRPTFARICCAEGGYARPNLPRPGGRHPPRVSMVGVASWRLTVDGNDWLVRDRIAEPGAYDFDLLTSPHRYGFSMGSSDGAPMDEAGMMRAISDFLAQVNHETGYLD